MKNDERKAPGDPPGSTYTSANGINKAGAITGYYSHANHVNHGFLRAPRGAISTFDPPGSKGTIANSINAAAAITGYYVDAKHVVHGFLRSP
jgi:hypothetical protein